MAGTQATFDQFREELRSALHHLHDPDYRPSGSLYAMMGQSPAHGVGPLQSHIQDVIKSLSSSSGPPGSDVHLFSELLHHRFLLGLSQEETADRLNLSVRHLRREERAATHWLARLLWEHGLASGVLERGSGAEAAISTPDLMALADREVDWRLQVREELAALKAGSVGKITDVGQALRAAVELESILTARLGITLRIEGVQANLTASVHPAALRQVLIMAASQLAEHSPSGEIIVSAAQEGGWAVITLSDANVEERMLDIDLIREIVAAEGGAFEVAVQGDRRVLTIRLPTSGEVSVLVVDDNPDSVHFYRRCTQGTRYRIAHAPGGKRAIEAITSAPPDIIVLDILLPDMDGWEVLAELRRIAATRSVPVIICSIVKEEQLASALGVVTCLPKPVRHSEFLRVLDEAFGQAPKSSPET
jgi:CheY-like chemotaxis protein